jgi:hypothetical protein
MKLKLAYAGLRTKTDRDPGFTGPHILRLEFDVNDDSAWRLGQETDALLAPLAGVADQWRQDSEHLQRRERLLGQIEALEGDVTAAGAEVARHRADAERSLSAADMTRADLAEERLAEARALLAKLEGRRETLTRLAEGERQAALAELATRIKEERRRLIDEILGAYSDAVADLVSQVAACYPDVSVGQFALARLSNEAAVVEELTSKASAELSGTAPETITVRVDKASAFSAPHFPASANGQPGAATAGDAPVYRTLTAGSPAHKLHLAGKLP